MVSPVDASVHIHLRGDLDDEGLAGLRQQLARCLASGVCDIVVHAETQPDLGLPALRTLYGAAAYLASSGGRLVLAGAQPAVLSRLRVFDLDDLLPGPSAPSSRSASAGISEASRPVTERAGG